MKKIVLCLVALITLFVCINPVAAAAEADTDSSYKNGETYKFMKEFCEKFPERIAGSEAMLSVSQYLQQKFDEALQGVGKTSLKPFVLEVGSSKTYVNVVAKIDRSSVSDKQIIVGAHYDSQTKGGANDNAGGVTALWSLMKRLASNASKLPVSVVFVAFDAEEMGLYGSQTYVNETMTSAERERTLLMINFDSIANGDDLYLWCENKRTDMADLFLSNSDLLKEKPYAKGAFDFDRFGYGYYEKVQGTDHTPFRLAGIPTACFFSGTFSSQVWNYAESRDPVKETMGTSLDTFENLEKYNGGAFVKKIDTAVSAVYETVLSQEFMSVAVNARSQLVKFDVWYNRLYPYLIAFGVVLLSLLFASLYYRKLQKNAILGTAEVKTQKTFSTPDAKDVFDFKDK